MAVISIEKRIDNQFRQIDAERWLGQLDEKDADRLRMAITRARRLQEPPLVRCGICKEPIYIKANPFDGNNYHFSHFQTNDPVLKRCIQRTDKPSNLELIRALKYQGAQESQLHYRLKHLISELLKQDTTIKSDTVKIEATLKKEFEWRRPDVQAEHQGRIIAFEVQVSTEMASIVVARESFYEKFGNILWILPKFSPATMNQSQRDILTTNHDHLYVLDKEMRRLSKDKCLLHLKAWVHWPVIERGELRRVWRNETVTLRDITFKSGHAQVLDVEREELRIKANLEKIKIQKFETEQNQLKELNLQKIRREEEWKLQEISEQFYRSKLILSDWDDWWDRWQALTKKLVDPRHQFFLRKELALEIPWGKQSSSLAGLWLTLHDIQILQCNCSEFVVRALICASKGALDFGYSSWKWIAKGLLKDHPSWFAPFHKILKENKHCHILEELKNDQSIQKSADELKQQPLLLNNQQRRLVGLLEPKLQLAVPNIDLEPYNDQGPVFLFKKIASTAYGQPDTIFPEELNIVNYYMGLPKLRGMGINESNIVGALKLIAANGHYLPFPNLPFKESDSQYCTSLNDCEEILPVWNEQLVELEKKLSCESLLITDY